MDNIKTCKHFGLCGGCKFQDIPYQEQIKTKEQRIKGLISDYGFKTEFKPINYFPEWFYRNKMEFTFACGDGKLICGLHSKKEKRQVFNVEECRIFSKNTGVILNKLREFAANKGYSAYNKFSHKGFLRHLILRESKFTGQLMLGLVTTTEKTVDSDSLIKELLSLKLDKKISSLYWIVNDSFGDAVTFQDKKLIYGQPFIVERINGFDFRINIDSFFQTNPAGISQLYKKIEEYSPLSRESLALDLYCGAGSIGMFLARKAKFVWGVEVIKSAVEGAFANAEINNVKNISFICRDVRKFLAERELKDTIGLIMINPPRCGLSKKIKSKLLKIDAPYIFYSSCNADSLFADLRDLSSGYEPEFVESFDFFPHTSHVEVFSCLKRIT